jgi:hypothetical protein
LARMTSYHSILVAIHYAMLLMHYGYNLRFTSMIAKIFEVHSAKSINLAFLRIPFAPVIHHFSQTLKSPLDLGLRPWLIWI